MAKSDTDVALDASAAIEQILERNFGASGRGLHEKLSSVEGQLDSRLASRIRYVATMRNRVVHERVAIDNRNRFEATAAQIISELGGKADPKPVPTVVRVLSGAWLLLMLGLALSVFAAGYQSNGIGGGLVAVIVTALVVAAVVQWIWKHREAIAGTLVLLAVAGVLALLWNVKLI